jgi:tRNA(fMet)-specific endonuclease VapC
MKKYLLDTTVAVDCLRGRAEMIRCVEAIGRKCCHLSEITVAELKHGAEKSDRPEHNRKKLDTFLTDFKIMCVRPALDIFASEKTRLEKLGTPLDNFDLLVGATAIHYDFILATNNVRHFDRMQRLNIENWTQ